MQPSSNLFPSKEAKQPIDQNEHGYDHEYSDVGASFEDVSDKFTAGQHANE